MPRQLYVPNRAQLLLMDGTKSAIDLVSRAAAIRSGGVANINKLTAENSSFEGGTVGGWAGWHTTNTIISTDAKYGSRCLRTVGTDVSPNAYLDIATVTVAGSQYTFSVWLKAGDAATIGEAVTISLYGNVSGHTYSAITLSADWQRATVTKTFNAGDTTRQAVGVATYDSGDVILVDAAQLEAGGVVHDFEVGQGVWQEPSNFLWLFGSEASIIGPAVDDLIDLESSSFEGGTVGSWLAINSATVAVSSAFSWHGSKSLKNTCAADANAGDRLIITAVTAAGSQYTATIRVKGVAGRSMLLQLWDNVSAHITTTFTATGDWQYVSVTKTFDAGSTNRLVQILYNAGGANGDVFYADAFQLESGGVAHQFALDYRAVCNMAIPAASVKGFSPGGDFTLALFLKTIWPGSDGITHTFFDTYAGAGVNEIYVSKTAGGALTFAVVDGTGAAKSKTMAVNATNWAAETPHVVICTRKNNGDGTGTLGLKLNSVAATVSTGVGTGLETAFGTNLYFGNDVYGSHPSDAAILPMILKGEATESEQARIFSGGDMPHRYRRSA